MCHDTLPRGTLETPSDGDTRVLLAFTQMQLSDRNTSDFFSQIL